MSTATFAVQPSSWVKFDERGCDWATDINNAYHMCGDLERTTRGRLHHLACALWTTYGMGELCCPTFRWTVD